MLTTQISDGCSQPVRKIYVFLGGEIFCPDFSLGTNILKRASNMIKPLQLKSPPKKNMNFNARPKFLGVLCELVLGCRQPKR